MFLSISKSRYFHADPNPAFIASSAGRSFSNKQAGSPAPAPDQKHKLLPSLTNPKADPVIINTCTQKKSRTRMNRPNRTNLHKRKFNRIVQTAKLNRIAPIAITICFQISHST